MHFSISLTKKPSPVQLGPKDVLRGSFQIAEKENGAGVQPHQVFLRFYDDISGEDGVLPIRVATSGKAKFELVSLVCFDSFHVLTTF